MLCEKFWWFDVFPVFSAEENSRYFSTVSSYPFCNSRDPTFQQIPFIVVSLSPAIARSSSSNRQSNFNAIAYTYAWRSNAPSEIFSFCQDKDTFHDINEHILHIHLAHRWSTITTKITAIFDKLYIVFPPEFARITSFWTDSKGLRVWSKCLGVVFSVSTHKGNPVNIHSDNGILNAWDTVEL